MDVNYYAGEYSTHAMPSNAIHESLWTFEVDVIDEGGRITVVITDDATQHADIRLAQIIEHTATEFYRANLSHIPPNAVRWIEKLVQRRHTQWSEILLTATEDRQVRLESPRWRALSPATIHVLGEALA